MFLSGSWTDVTADVLSTPYIQWESGKQYDEPTAFVADIGKLEFWMNNSNRNSGGVAGYYSPGHASARADFELGTRVRVKTTYAGSDRYHFHGRISEIQPLAGRYGKRRTHVVVTDYMDEMTSRMVDILTLQSSKTSDQLLTTLIATMDIAPQATSYDVGPDTFASAFHDVAGERMAVATIAQKIVQSDLSRLYVRGDATGGETLILTNRQDDIGKTSQLTLNDTMTDLNVERSRRNIANKIVVSFAPINEGTSNEVLYTLPDELQLNAGANYTFTALYRDPDGGSRLNGKTMVTPVADTDYKFSSVSGSGNDLNASLSITLNSGYNTGGDRAEITLTNNHATATGYLWLFQLRGLALRLRDAMEVTSENPASITAYGEKRLQFNTPYQNSFNVTREISDYLKSKWANPKYKITNVSFTGSSNATLMNAAVNRDIGDMITVTETLTGINADQIVIGYRKQITNGRNWNVSLTLKDDDGGDYWLLGTSGSSELGETTTLGF